MLRDIVNPSAQLGIGDIRYKGDFILAQIVDYPVTTDEQAAMQEDVNVILGFLFNDPNFEMG